MMEELCLVVQGQQERNILNSSMKDYLSRCRSMTRIINSIEGLREVALDIDETGVARKHTGLAKDVLKLKLPMTVQTAKLLFAKISIDTTLPKKRKHCEHEVAESREDPEVVEGYNPAANKATVTAQTFQNFKSALKWWHCYDSPDMDKIGSPWPNGMDEALKKSISSYKRDIAGKKRAGIMRQKEGKEAYNLNGYIEINKAFSRMRPSGKQRTWDEGIFAGLFTVLSVSTAGKSDNVDDCLLSNFGWRNDALTVVFGTTKFDRTGQTTSIIKRCYANPFKPDICVVLKLAVYVLCTRRNGVAGPLRLFEGREQNKRYYNILTQVIQMMDDSVDLGCSKQDIGTQSNRKFAECTSSSRIYSFNKTQVCPRGAESVGDTQDSYTSSEEDCDALVGRTVAQLKLTADEFDVLPLHFDFETLQYIGTTLGWSSIIPDYNMYPQRFREQVIPKLVASVVYHYKHGDLERMYPRDHPVFNQRLFTDRSVYDTLKDKPILCFGECKESNMYATGVPGLIRLSREVRQVRDEIRAEKSNCRNDIRQWRELAIHQTDVLRNNMPEGDVNGDSSAGLQVQSIHVWEGSSHLHRVPMGFQFPSYVVGTMWNLWFFGNERENIGPYMFITPSVDLPNRGCKNNFCRCKKVMTKLVNIAIQGNKIHRLQDICKSNEQEVYDYAYTKLLQSIYDVYPIRPASINVNTVANKIKKK